MISSSLTPYPSNMKEIATVLMIALWFWVGMNVGEATLKQGGTYLGIPDKEGWQTEHEMFADGSYRITGIKVKYYDHTR